MALPKQVNIKEGISPKNLIEHLKTSKQLILIGEKKRVEIDEEKIRIIDAQIITQQNIPDEIKGIKVDEFQKELLLQNGNIFLGKTEVKLDFNEMKITLHEMNRRNQHQQKLR